MNDRIEFRFRDALVLCVECGKCPTFFSSTTSPGRSFLCTYCSCRVFCVWQFLVFVLFFFFLIFVHLWFVFGIVCVFVYLYVRVSGCVLIVGGNNLYAGFKDRFLFLINMFRCAFFSHLGNMHMFGYCDDLRKIREKNWIFCFVVEMREVKINKFGQISNQNWKAIFFKRKGKKMSDMIFPVILFEWSIGR